MGQSSIGKPIQNSNGIIKNHRIGGALRQSTALARKYNDFISTTAVTQFTGKIELLANTPPLLIRTKIEIKDGINRSTFQTMHFYEVTQFRYGMCSQIRLGLGKIYFNR
jgi:hypothetical protein